MAIALEFNKLSKYYDALDDVTETNSKNRSLEKILKKYKVKTVLDLTCGTGSQVFWLAKRGYEVTGSDLSPALLKMAKSKAKKLRTNVKLLNGDMRTIKVGTFDAAITMFNAVGNLTKPGFEKAMRNIYMNLKDGGIYIFDIANSNCRENADSRPWTRQTTLGNIQVLKVQHSELDRESGVLMSYDIFYVQKGSDKPKIFEGSYPLQFYTAKEHEPLRALARSIS